MFCLFVFTPNLIHRTPRPNPNPHIPYLTRIHIVSSRLFCSGSDANCLQASSLYTETAVCCPGSHPEIGRILPT